MKILFLKQNFCYTGKELRPLFLYEHGLRGDGVLAWRGSCDVQTQELVDAEDREQKDFIKAQEMVHFLAEFFHKDIFFGICMQRLFAEITIDVLRDLSCGGIIKREGDDIYIDNKKLNVSIATKTPLSTLIHFAINIDSEGAPVKAIGLKDLKIDVDKFVKFFLDRVATEVKDIYEASVKVFCKI